MAAWASNQEEKQNPPWLARFGPLPPPFLNVSNNQQLRSHHLASARRTERIVKGRRRPWRMTALKQRRTSRVSRSVRKVSDCFRGKQTCLQNATATLDSVEPMSTEAPTQIELDYRSGLGARYVAPHYRAEESGRHDHRSEERRVGEE